MNTPQRIAKNTLSLLISGAVSQLLLFVSLVYLARVLGADNFGKISLANAIVIYFTIFANLGLPLLGTREIARDRNRIGDYFSNILMLRACLAVLSFSFLLALILLLNKPDEVKELIFLYGIGILFSPLSIDWVFQGIEKMEYIGLGKILSAAAFVATVLIVVKGPEHLLLVPCFQIAASLLASSVLIVIFIKTVAKMPFKITLNAGQRLLREALPLGISIILIQTIYHIDTVMIGFMRSNAEVGYYNAAYKIILPLIMVGSIYFDATFPVMSNYYKSSLDSLNKLQSFNTKLMTVIAVPLAVGGTFLAFPLMKLIYGPEYNNGARSLQILIWVVALIYLNMIYARGMWACNKQDAYVKIVLCQAMTNVLLNCVLIPCFGIVGAAISTVASELLGLFFYYREFNKVVHVPAFKHIYKPLIATAIMTPTLVLAKSFNILFVIALSTLVYFSSLYAIKGITKEEMKAIHIVIGMKRA